MEQDSDRNVDRVKNVGRVCFCNEGCRRVFSGVEEKLCNLGLRPQRELGDVGEASDESSGVKTLVDTGRAPCCSELQL